MIFLQAPPPTSTDWIDACIFILDGSMKIGSHLYPFLFALNIFRLIGNVI